jgi:hypothetical protein
LTIRGVKKASIDFNFFAEASFNSHNYKTDHYSYSYKSARTKHPVNYVNRGNTGEELTDVIPAYFFYRRFIKTYHLKLSSFLLFSNNRGELKQLFENKMKWSEFLKILTKGTKKSFGFYEKIKKKQRSETYSQ